MSSVALLACLLLQEPLCQLLYRASDSIISETPCVPVGQVVYLLGNLAAAFFLLLCLLVLLTRTTCSLCGRPVYCFFLRFCGH